MLRTPSFVSIYLFPIVVIGGRRPCVKSDLIPIIATSVRELIMKTTAVQLTLDPPPRARPVGMMTERSRKAGLGFAS